MTRSIRASGRWSIPAGLTVLALVLTACTSNDPDSELSDTGAEPGDSTAADPVALAQAENSPKEDVPSALDDLRDPAFPEPLIDLDQILSGGPPPDGIPAIDNPKFQPVAEVDWLADDEAVLAITVEGETRGYPFQVLTWHEIVNDTIADVPVAVSYCPLCNSGVAFDRRVDGKVLDFGTSGLLHASNLVMYDRQTESLWPQLTGQASVGAMTGTELEFIPLSPVGWADFREAHPDAMVLSRDTGHNRDYGRNPYVGYDVDPNNQPLFGAPTEDDRLLPLERIITLQGQTETAAVVRSAVEETGVLVTSIDDQPLALLFAKGQNSALEAGSVAEGRDIGTVAVFDPTVDGEVLTFVADGEAFKDEQTGSTWNISGQAIDGPHEGTTLEAYPFIDTFWESWVAFKPDTRIIDG